MRKIEVFVDGVDWQHEIDAVDYGTKVYPTLEDAKKYLPCHKSCGIVKCTIQGEDWAVKQDIFRGPFTVVDGSKKYSNKQVHRARINAAIAHRKYLEKQVKKANSRINKLKKESKNVKNN